MKKKGLKGNSWVMFFNNFTPLAALLFLLVEEEAACDFIGSLLVSQVELCKHLLKVASLPLNIPPGKTKQPGVTLLSQKPPIKAVCIELIHRPHN